MYAKMHSQKCNGRNVPYNSLPVIVAINIMLCWSADR